MLSSAGITKRLDRLVGAGLVERRPDPADRRGTLVRLTPRGKTAVDKALTQHVANEARLLETLSPAQRKQLDGVLRKPPDRAGEAGLGTGPVRTRLRAAPTGARHRPSSHTAS